MKNKKTMYKTFCGGGGGDTLSCVVDFFFIYCWNEMGGGGGGGGGGLPRLRVSWKNYLPAVSHWLSFDRIGWMPCFGGMKNNNNYLSLFLSFFLFNTQKKMSSMIFSRG